MTNPDRRPNQSEIILHAARQLFARQGYHGTSTKELARLAGVSENTLFRYFDRKEDLFWAALRSSLSGLELRLDLLTAMAEDPNPGVVLPKVFTQLMDATTLRPELLRLIVIAFIELPWKASAVLYEHLSPLISKVNEFIARGIESGRLRAANSSLVTAAMVTTAIGYPAIASMIAGIQIPYSDDREAIQAYSKFWLDLLVPTGMDRFRAAAQSPASPRD